MADMARLSGDEPCPGRSCGLLYDDGQGSTRTAEQPETSGRLAVAISRSQSFFVTSEIVNVKNRTAGGCCNLVFFRNRYS